MWEAKERQAFDFATQPPYANVSGSNPFALASLGENRAVGLLRGSSEIVLLGPKAKEMHRVPAPPGAVAMAHLVSAILVVGEGSSEIWKFEVSSDKLTRTATYSVRGARSLRAIAARSAREVFVADSRHGTIIELDLARPKRARVIDRCHEPVALLATANYLLANCVSDHQVRIWRKQVGGRRALQPIQHDGPLWSFDAVESAGGELLTALSGIEDHPLDRSDQGSFGYIDSFVFLYQIEAKADSATRLAAINVGELGLITPKWVELYTKDVETQLITAGFGSPTLLTIRWQSSDLAAPPKTSTAPLFPGTTGRIELAKERVYAAPLFDAWFTESGGRTDVAPKNNLGIESQIGELLFFTELMAPWSSSSARKSKFTCEACHFEGYVDGRIHFTGRDDVSATSRPLRGLFNNSPHFSRALDETSTEMVDNEFRVANKLNGRSSWFDLKASDFPWLQVGGVKAPPAMTAAFLRRSLMSFLRDFNHSPNPAVRGRTAYSRLESRGAAIFRDRCEECHRAQLVASDERTRVEFDRWPALIFSKTGGLVWGRMSYEKTGVLPYVHERGARPPTLRRLYKKWPYFTNGSAKTLDSVVRSFRYGYEKDRVSHAAEPGGKALTDKEVAAVLAFLDLL